MTAILSFVDISSATSKTTPAQTCPGEIFEILAFIHFNRISIKDVRLIN